MVDEVCAGAWFCCSDGGSALQSHWGWCLWVDVALSVHTQPVLECSGTVRYTLLFQEYKGKSLWLFLEKGLLSSQLPICGGATSAPHKQSQWMGVLEKT